MPLKLKLHNFAAVSDSEVDLSNITLASVVGRNGISKSSTFVYAPLFALFGKPRPNCSIDDMVKTGTQDVLVQFEFEHNGELYQITRTRKLGKKSTCELQKLTGGNWLSLTEAKIADTDKKIEALLSLDANTFLASSLIMQGDASNFTKKLPGERKAILTQILGIEIYDRLQQAAKGLEKSLTIQLETSKNKLLDLEEKLKALPEVEQQMLDIDKSITLNAVDIREKETALSGAQAKIKDLEGREQAANEAKKQMDAICTDIKAIDQKIADHDLKIQNAKRVLMDEADILAKIAELDDIKAQIPALQAKEDRIAHLKADGKKLTDEMIQMKLDRDKLHSKIIVLEQDLSSRDDLKQANDDYQQGLTTLSELEKTAEEWWSYQDDILRSEKQLEQSESYIKQLQAELKNHETKANLLNTANCPVSGEITCVFLKDATEAKKQIPIVESDLINAEKERMVIQDIIKGLTDQQEGLSYDKTHHADLKKRIELLRPKAEAYSQLAGKEEVLQNLTEQRDSTIVKLNLLQDSLDAIQKETKRLQAEAENLPILKAKIPTLEKYVTLKDKLPEARTTMKLSQEAIGKLQSEIEQKNEQHRQLLIDYASLSAEFSGLLPESRQRVQDIEGELKVLSVNQNNLYADQGTIKANLDALQGASEEKDKLSTELAPKAKELVRWQTLVKAFGKAGGIPTLILENAIPELERISNDILSQMSNGAHSLRFETQRDLKSKDGVAETLDIIVSDWAGSRPYETYSGGEQLRIDLAIRFALSELLANRAGSKVEWICADEVMSSQDPEHRQLIIDAIKAVSNRFKMILVISHIPEIQSAFDQRIILSEGGKAEVVFS